MLFRSSLSPRVLLFALLLTFLAASGVYAQAGTGVLKDGTISGVGLAVWHPDSKDELAQLKLGDTLVLDENESVMIRMFAPRGKGPGNQRWYLSADYSVVSGGDHVRLTNIDRDKGSATLTALKGTGSQAVQLRYEIRGGIKVSRKFLAKGIFDVEVAGANSQPVPDVEATRSEEMVDRLFMGILLREPGKARDKFAQRLEEGGYPELVQVAFDIADSQESRVTIYRNGASNEERLISVYDQLLNKSAEQADKAMWRDHLDMMARGEFNDVILDIVRSPEFRRMHGYMARPYRPQSWRNNY